MEEDLQEAQGSVNTLNTDITTLEIQRNNAVNTLDGFSDNIVQKINSLKSALEQEEITDTTLTQVNALISSFNSFVPNINSNTPPTSPVTQISEFDTDSGNVEDNSDIFPSEFPQWLGGGNIMEEGEVDEPLFDLENSEYSPWFNLPDLTYGIVPNELPVNSDILQDSILMVIRPIGLKYLFGGLQYPYLIKRSSNYDASKFLSNKPMFNEESKKIYSYDQGTGSFSKRYFNQLVRHSGKSAALRISVNSFPDGGGSVIYNTDVGSKGARDTYSSDLTTGERKFYKGNANLLSISDYFNYDEGNKKGIYMVNGRNSFRIRLKAQDIPYKVPPPVPDLPGVAQGIHTYSVGLQLDFIVKKDDGTFTFKTKKVVGNFNFTQGYLVDAVGS